MKLKVVVLFLLCFFINCSVLANSSQQLGEEQSVKSVAGEINELLQHNFLVVNLTKFQRSLNESLSFKIKELKNQNNLSLLCSILMGAFIYGIFHALGPGHGKSIISSWIMGQQRSLGEVLFIAMFAAAFHALSAALIVGGTYVIVGKFATVSAQQLNVDLQIAAALLLIGIGCSMMIRLIQSKLTTTNLYLVPKTTTHQESPIFVALSIGVVPCPVTSVILIFCLTLGLIWQGLLLVLSFAIGMGVSLVAISLLVWSLKEKIIAKKLATLQYVVTTLLPLTGGLFLILMGAIILQSF